MDFAVQIQNITVLFTTLSSHRFLVDLFCLLPLPQLLAFHCFIYGNLGCWNGCHRNMRNDHDHLNCMTWWKHANFMIRSHGQWAESHVLCTFYGLLLSRSMLTRNFLGLRQLTFGLVLLTNLNVNVWKKVFLGLIASHVNTWLLHYVVFASNSLSLYLVFFI